MWAALLGALLGGLLALAGSLMLELRRERRQQITAARGVARQLRRSQSEFDAFGKDLFPDTEHDEEFIDGPHEEFRVDAWNEGAAHFVGRLSAADLELLDHVHDEIRGSGEYGFTVAQSREASAEINAARSLIEPVATPSRFDLLVWRL